MKKSKFINEKRTENELSGNFARTANVLAHEYVSEGSLALSNIAEESPEEYRENRDKWEWVLKGGTALVGVGVVWGITKLLT